MKSIFMVILKYLKIVVFNAAKLNANLHIYERTNIYRSLWLLSCCIFLNKHKMEEFLSNFLQTTSDRPEKNAHTSTGIQNADSAINKYLFLRFFFPFKKKKKRKLHNTTIQIQNEPSSFRMNIRLLCSYF